MNRFFLLFTLAIFTLSAEIHETLHFKDLLNHITPDTLVVLDIDDTLLLPSQTLGSDVWFCHRWKEHQQNGLSKDDALEKSLAEWEAIRHLTEVCLVEEGTDQVVKDAQNRGVPVMALSTQGVALTTRTFQQLLSLNIDMTKAAPSLEQFYFMNDKVFAEGIEGALYRNGILFTSGTKKGKALMILLEKMKLQPKHVLFINDKRSHLMDLEEDVEAAGLRFTGLRYNIGDERVKNFSPQIAETQWLFSTFDRILSDEEARCLFIGWL